MLKIKEKIKDLIRNVLNFIRWISWSENDGPLLIDEGWRKKWVMFGVYHREDGPAVIMYGSEGKTYFWCKLGSFHRINGPAIDYPDGSKRWYIEGINYSESQYIEKIWDTLDLKKQEEIIFNGFRWVD